MASMMQTINELQEMRCSRGLSVQGEIQYRAAKSVLMFNLLSNFIVYLLTKTHQIHRLNETIRPTRFALETYYNIFQGGGETCNYFDRTNTDSISKMLANI